MIIGSDPDYDTNESTGSVVLEDKPEIKEPPLYQVVLINDDYTPMEFVIYVLESIFHHNHEEARQYIPKGRVFVVYFLKK